MLLFAVLLFLGSAVAAGASTVEVRLSAEGASMNDLAVFLETANGGPSSYTRESRSDASGLARFNNVSPGTYTIRVDTVPPGYVAPGDNPLRPAPIFTLVGRETFNATVWIERGVPVTVSVDAEKISSEFRALFKHRESGKELSTPFNVVESTMTRFLAPGLWHVSMRAPPGSLLVDLRHDGQPANGSEVAIDLAAHPTGTSLAWTYTAPSRLTGLVRSNEEIANRIHIEIELVRAGAWLAEAKKRGGSVYERLGARIVDGRFETSLPDGRWRVRPVGKGLVESRPPQAEIEIRPGGEGHVEFDVTLGEENDSKEFIVEVVDPEGRRIDEAIFEIYAVDADGNSEGEPLVTEYSSSEGNPVPGLPAGEDYVLVAGHVSYLEGRVLLREFQPEPMERVRVELGAGSVVRVRAEDADGKPVTGAHVRLERLEDVQLQVRDTYFADAKRAREITTDDSGWATLLGLYPGSYRASARPKGTGAAASPRRREDTVGAMVVGPVDGPYELQPVVEITAGERLDLVARRQAAVTGLLRLRCTDGWTLPESVAFYVYDAQDPNAEAVLAYQKVSLTGPSKDRLAIGPLLPGSYLVAVLPSGFTRWTWAPGTFIEAEAGSLSLDAGERQALGSLALECAPAVDILPEAADGGVLPPFSEVKARAFVEQGGETTELTATAKAAGQHSVGQHFAVRGLPGGETLLDVVLEHPTFLPEPALRWSMPLDLKRGEYLLITPQVEDVGGAVRAVCGSCVAAGAGTQDRQGPYFRLQRDGVILGLQDLTAGEALFPSLAAGNYAAVLCEDEVCERVVRRWPDLVVKRGEVTRVNADDVRPEG